MRPLETIGEALGWEWRTMRINPAKAPFTPFDERLTDEQRKAAIRAALRAYPARKQENRSLDRYSNTALENRPRDIMSVTEYIERRGVVEW